MKPATEMRGCWASTPIQCSASPAATTGIPLKSTRRGAAAISRRRSHSAARLASGRNIP